MLDVENPFEGITDKINSTESISEFEIEILKFIDNSKMGATDKSLSKEFKEAGHLVLANMMSKELVDRNFGDGPKTKTVEMGGVLFDIPALYTGNFFLTELGRIALAHHEAKKRSVSREKWADRIWGFVLGALVTLIIGFILFLLGWN